MKKFNLFTVILAVLFLSSFLTKQLYASEPFGGGNKWKIISVTVPSTCKLGAKEFTFNIKVKNIANEKSTKEKITLNVTHEDDWDKQTFKTEFWTPQIKSGKTATFSVLVSNEKIKNLTNSAGSKTIQVSVEMVCAAGTTIITKSVIIKVK
jgi:hypothetical protein